MRQVHPSNLTPGDELAREFKVPSSHSNVQYRLRLPAGTELSPNHIERLQDIGIKHVPIVAAQTGDLDDYMYDEKVEAAENELRDSFYSFQSGLESGSLDKQNISKLRTTVNQLIEALEGSELMAAYTNLKTHDSYTAEHSLDVTKITLQLAIRYEDQLRLRLKNSSGASDKYINRHMLADLGIGTILHDLGKVEIDRDVLLKDGELNDQEWSKVQQHPEIGYKNLNELRYDLNLPVMTPARQHHEKYDGTGYPRGLKGEEVHLFGRLTACADVYSALTSKRPYRNSMTPAKALDVMHNMQNEGPHFDPDIFSKFKTIVYPYPVGQDVMLSDGREAVVCSIDEARPDQPTVRVLETGQEIHVPNRPDELRIANSDQTQMGIVR